MTVKTSETSRTMRKRFGARLQQMRVDAEVTQLGLARSLGYAYPTTVSQIERGVSGLPPAELARWAAALHTDLKVFVDMYLYYNEPYLYAALYGQDPYAAEKLPKDQSTIEKR